MISVDRLQAGARSLVLLRLMAVWTKRASSSGRPCRHNSPRFHLRPPTPEPSSEAQAPAGPKDDAAMEVDTRTFDDILDGDEGTKALDQGQQRALAAKLAAAVERARQGASPTRGGRAGGPRGPAGSAAAGTLKG
ncbi:unnamed protein product [Prorocentrum cordatum]|uniref:Uncharacterized protein n=1 Tax=Prorocentrum cordatum TaxID=2364126 RepID=A0ABN9XES9_9DINO|nr:unnamed protein product [Polarella glacialis]